MTDGELTTKLDRMERLLVAIWDQQQQAKHAPPPVESMAIATRIIEIAEEIADRHPTAKTLNHQTAHRVLDQLTGPMLKPVASAEAINRHHAWRCRYEWAGKDVAFIPKLLKWLQEEGFSPCPSEAEGEAMRRGPERMSRAERDLAEIEREMSA